MYAKYRNQLESAWRKAVPDYEKSLLKKVNSNPKAFVRYAKNKLNLTTMVKAY